MRFPVAVVLAAVAVSACTDAPVGPYQALQSPTVQMSQLGAPPATTDLCGGLSPCDAYDYRGDGSIGAPGMCFLPPTVDNHLSDPACSAPNEPGLSGIFKLAWCRVLYADPTGATPPTIATKANGDPDCADPSEWKPLMEENDHYATSVQWKRSEAKEGDYFRIYVVRGTQMFAHRDLVIHPNQTEPADDFVHSIGFSNEPVKLRINSDFTCIAYDTQAGGTDNAATCLIAGETSISLVGQNLSVVFNFPDGNAPFVGDFEISECLALGFDLTAAGDTVGNALVDTPLADCKLSLSSEEILQLDVPAQVIVTLNDDRWDVSGPFEHARLNVLEYDEFGLGALPPAEDPGWFGMATSSSAALRLLNRGLDKLASLILPEKAFAAVGTGAGWNVTRMSDLQVAVMPIMTPAFPGTACPSGDAFCTDLGSFTSGSTTPVTVRVTAPDTSGILTPAHYLNVPDTRLHFFPENGTLTCPGGVTSQDSDGRGCVMPGDDDNSTTPPSHWPDHVVVITGPDGLGTATWAPADGSNVLHVSACGVARPGPNEPNSLGGDNVWGDLLPICADREAAMTATGAYDNGPADGFSPFEPVDTYNEAAVYGLPLEFLASTCPTITVDGVKGANEWVCATETVFTAPQKGPKVENNAKLYTYSDGTTLYVGVEVQSTDLGNRMFMALTDAVASGDGVEAPGDELLVLDFGNPSTPIDWHNTQQCLGNNSSSLCGAIDAATDAAGFAAQAAGSLNGAGSGTTFYEFSRPLGATLSPKEDLGAAYGAQIGLRLVLTQGQGGGKGGFVFPDPQTSTKKYYTITVD